MQRETVGIVESGITAAQWSPDDELLVIVTGEGKLMEMTSEFELLLEANLKSNTFGESTFCPSFAASELIHETQMLL